MDKKVKMFTREDGIVQCPWSNEEICTSNIEYMDKDNKTGEYTVDKDVCNLCLQGQNVEFQRQIYETLNYSKDNLLKVKKTVCG